MLEGEDLDSLRGKVRALEEENRVLKERLAKAGLPAEKEEAAKEDENIPAAFDPDQAGRLLARYVKDDWVKRFGGYFWGRTDVFAVRGKSGGYFPQCENRWNGSCPVYRGEKHSCPKDCNARAFRPLTLQILKRHLFNQPEEKPFTVAIYPQFPDGSTRLLVFDFDDHDGGGEKSRTAAKRTTLLGEVAAMRLVCEENGVPCLVERSRSGKGAHIWIFFQDAIPAAKARDFATLLLEQGAGKVNLPVFRCYDRMRPSADELSDPKGSLGSCIALPFQGQAMRFGNTCFVDENWNCYPDQWGILLNTKKMPIETVEMLARSFQALLPPMAGRTRPKPWERNDPFAASDVTGSLHVVLSDGIYCDVLNVRPRLQNQLRNMATLSNPKFYENRAMGYSNYDTPSALCLAEDVDGYVRLPRGLFESLKDRCEKAGISMEVTDRRQSGRPIRASFQGELRLQQQLASQQLLSHDNGILEAATAFGKTVVGAYLIAQNAVSTLILVPTKELALQWKEKLLTFLSFEEDLPVRVTPSGRRKKADSCIGMRMSGKTDALYGIVDIALAGSINHDGVVDPAIRQYGQILVDEAHHGAALTMQQILAASPARYVYGMTATLARNDQLETITRWMIGPVRHTFSARERAQDQGIAHLVRPRFTRTSAPDADTLDFLGASELIRKDPARNAMIEGDARTCLKEGRSVLILSKYKDQAKTLWEDLQGDAQHVFLLFGDNTTKENAEQEEALRQVPANESLLLVATAQKVGEGFDCPRLDTLLLVSPVSGEAALTQYVGRLNRDYETKKDVIVYDYVDRNLPVLDRMYQKRLRIYKKIGYGPAGKEELKRAGVGAIFEKGDYTPVFEQDFVRSKDSVVLSSKMLSPEKVDRLLYLTDLRGGDQGEITVLTLEPDLYRFQDSSGPARLIREMEEKGIRVETRTELSSFAIFDRTIVWYGSVSFLGKTYLDDTLIRVQDPAAVEDLLEAAFGKEENASGTT